MNLPVKLTSSLEPEPKKLKILHSPTDNTFKGEINLPSEIWAHIFEFLKFNDRKTAKRVCRCWYSVLTSSPRFFEKEKLVCRRFRTFAWNQFLKPHSKIPCLELHNVNLSYFSNDTWIEYGLEITDLRFINCTIQQQEWDYVIQCCKNLTNLHSNISRHIPGKVLDRLRMKGVVRKSLTTITTKVPSISWLKKLFVIFPCINTLNIVEVNSKTVNKTQELLESLGNSGFVKESLALYFSFKRSLHFFSGSLELCKMLQEFTFEEIIDGTSAAKGLLEFVSQLHLLKKLKVKAIVVEGMSTNIQVTKTYLIIELMNIVLNKNLGLNSLHLEHRMHTNVQKENLSVIFFCSSLLKKLITSKLEYFCLISSELYFTKIETCEYLQNHILKCLIIKIPMKLENDRYFNILTKIFRSVKISILKSYMTNNDVLRTIVDYQRNLVSLSFMGFHLSEDTKVEIFPLSKLKSLKYLRLHLTRHVVFCEDKLCLPNLEFMYLDFHKTYELQFQIFDFSFTFVYLTSASKPPLMLLQSLGEEDKIYGETETIHI